MPKTFRFERQSGEILLAKVPRHGSNAASSGKLEAKQGEHGRVGELRNETCARVRPQHEAVFGFRIVADKRIALPVGIATDNRDYHGAASTPPDRPAIPDQKR
jgi:hypothetical protein